MELRTYWTIIWRRIWVVALVVGVVALYVGYQYYNLRKTPGALKAYSTSTTIQIGLQPTSNGNQYTIDYITVSEALADTMATGPILNSRAFDQDVSNQIGRDSSLIQQRYGPNPDLGDWQNASAIGQSLSAVRAHSLVTITTNWNTAAGAWAIANAVGEVSVEKAGSYLDYSMNNSAVQNSTGRLAPSQVYARVVTIPPISGTISGPSSNKVPLYALMLLIALGLGIALTFLLDYLDDRIRSKDQVTQLLGIPIFAVVPPAPAPGRSRSPAPKK